jgi:23S rRNA pseudouridine1911/1915/1917 synthase
MPDARDSAGLDVIYHEGPCIVVNKRSGISTQAPPGIESVELLMKDYLRCREGKTGNIYVGVPHRLDRPVSGALLFARHVRATRRLAEQFRGRLVRKIYWAIVEGRPDQESGTWQDFVRKIPGRAAAEVVAETHPEARPATLQYVVRHTTELFSSLEIELQTGRTHQIRVQAASRGFPVVGDTQYGSRQTFGPSTDDFRRQAIALHARSLEFFHPMTRAPVTVAAPLPVSWAALADDLQLDTG